LGKIWRRSERPSSRAWPGCPGDMGDSAWAARVTIISRDFDLWSHCFPEAHPLSSTLRPRANGHVPRAADNGRVRPDRTCEVVAATGAVMFGAGLIFWCFSFTYFLPVLGQRLKELRPAWFQNEAAHHDPNLHAGRWIAFTAQRKSAVARRDRTHEEVVPSNRRWLRQGTS
jgi:hypothetical protein